MIVNIVSQLLLTDTDKEPSILGCPFCAADSFEPLPCPHKDVIVGGRNVSPIGMRCLTCGELFWVDSDRIFTVDPDTGAEVDPYRFELPL